MFLDIAIGILLAVGAGRYFDIGPSFFLVAAVLFALLPDFDFLIELFKRRNVGGKIIGEHRRITHYPLVYMPVAVLIYLFAGGAWALVFAFAIIFHFIHDSIAFGWGIQWLWPFSKNHFVFFRKSLKTERPGLPFKMLYIWTPEKAGAMAAEYGDSEWIKNYYFRPNVFLAVEIVALITAIFVFFQNY